MELVARTFFRVPVIGWLASDAVHGHSDAKYYFIANLLLGFAFLVYVFGYPFLICFALAAAALALTFIVVLTASDLFGGNSTTLKPRARVRPTKA